MNVKLCSAGVAVQPSGNRSLTLPAASPLTLFETLTATLTEVGAAAIGTTPTRGEMVMLIAGATVSKRQLLALPGAINRDSLHGAREQELHAFDFITEYAEDLRRREWKVEVLWFVDLVDVVAPFVCT